MVIFLHKHHFFCTIKRSKSFNFSILSKKIFSASLQAFWLLLVIFAALQIPEITHAATLTVNSTNDGVAVDGVCTLREAVQAANNNANQNECVGVGGYGTDTIQLSTTSTYNVGSGGEMSITSSMSIIGTSSGGLLSNISGGDLARVFNVSSTASLTLQDLKVTHGLSGAEGGAIRSSSSGTLTLLNVTISNNNAYIGGGLAIYNGTTIITNSSIINNASTYYAGGIDFANGTITFENSSISGNSTAQGGGGIVNINGTVTANNTTISNNTSTIDDGGGIYSNSTVTLTNSTLSGNTTTQEGGGFYNSGTATLTNVTVNGNNANLGGGGVYTHGGTVTMKNVTVKSNTASSNAGGVEGTGTVNLKSSLLASNTSTGNCGGSALTKTNNGSNLQYGDTTCGVGITQTLSDPFGGAVLADNGGPTQTVAIAVGSAAVNNGDSLTCTATDQRGLLRDGNCDIGAYELEIAPTVTNVTSSTSNGTFKIGNTVSIQIVFSETAIVTGTPQLILETGTTDAVVNYASGSGSDTLTFTYTVASGETSADLDYAGTSSLGLNSGTIKDAAANDATLTLSTPGAAGSLGANKDLVIDGIVPVFSSITPLSGSLITNYTTSSAISYSLSENVASGTITMTRTGGSADPSSPQTCTLIGTGLSSGSHTINLADTVNGCSVAKTLVDGAVYSFTYNATDAAGNAATTITNTNITLDQSGPTVTNVTSSTTNGTYGIGNTVSIQIVFSETAIVTGTPQLILETGTTDAVVNYASGSGSDTLTFTYTVASGETSADLDYAGTSSLGLNSGTIKDAAANDATLTLSTPGAAGSLGANKNLVIDGIPPVVTPPSSPSSTPNVTSSGPSSFFPYNSVLYNQTPSTISVPPITAPANTTTNNPESTTVPVAQFLECGREETGFPFTDVFSDSSLQLVEKYYRSCIVDGRSKNLFVPDGEITRAEFARIIFRLFKFEKSPFQDLFTDVKLSDWFFQDVTTLANKNIIKGYLSSTNEKPSFKPLQSLSKAEALRIILNSKGIISANTFTESISATTTAGFHDVNQSDWFYDDVLLAESKGLIDGKTWSFSKQGLVALNYNFTRYLRLNNQGKDVYNLKSILAQTGFYKGMPDQVFDYELQAALISYQKKNNLPATGIFGPLTIQKISTEYLQPVTYKYWNPNQQISRIEALDLLEKILAVF